MQPDGRSHFYKLLFRREWPYFYAFDALAVNCEDLRGLPLLERKRRLLQIMPRIDTRLLYLDHMAERGRDLYRVACDRDLEGIVECPRCASLKTRAARSEVRNETA